DTTDFLIRNYTTTNDPVVIDKATDLVTMYGGIGVPTLALGRDSGNFPSIEATTAAGGHLIMDSKGSGRAYLNGYNSGDVTLANGGGSVGIGSNNVGTALLEVAGTGLFSGDITAPNLELSGYADFSNQVRLSDSTARAGLLQLDNITGQYAGI